MKNQDNFVTFSIGNFKTIDTFKHFFHDIANFPEVLRKEQKDLIMNRKRKSEEDDYFGFIKFLFTNPNTLG